MDFEQSSPQSEGELVFLTWNIAETAPSFSSPPDWSQEKNSTKIIELVKKIKPDVFTLQEIPAFEKDYAAYFPDYESTTPFPTHSGYVQLFCLKLKGLRFLDSKRIGPTMLSRIELCCGDSKASFRFAGGHLEPFRHSADKRLAQIKKLVEEVDPSEPFIFAGDMNMREVETAAVLKECSLKDMFIETGSDSRHEFTWDTKINKYFPPRGGDSFFQGRFDRVFFRNCKPSEFKMFANEPASEKNFHYLSDHFGLACRVSIQSKE